MALMEPSNVIVYIVIIIAILWVLAKVAKLVIKLALLALIIAAALAYFNYLPLSELSPLADMDNLTLQDGSPVQNVSAPGTNTSPEEGLTEQLNDTLNPTAPSPETGNTS